MYAASNRLNARSIRGHLLAASLLSTALLGACAPAEEPASPSTPAVAPAPTNADEAMPAQTSVSNAAAGTVGGDGSEIRLDPLQENDLTDAQLEGELACVFAEGNAAPLLYAMGVVGSTAHAQGVVKVAGYVETVRAPGGFEGLRRGPTFTGQGKTIRIEQTGDATGGGESPWHPATLTYLRADGASRSFEGRWQCGP